MIKLHILDRLRSSLTELDEAIKSAKKVLLKKDIGEQYKHRLDSYDSMLLQQKKLLLELEKHVTSVPVETEKVQRCVSLINGLSTMIRDDARSLLLEIGRGGGLSKRELDLFNN